MTPWSNASWERLAHDVAARAGLALERDIGHAEMVFARAAQEAGEAPATFAAHVAPDPEQLDALVDVLTIGETYFFRDPGLFEFLRREAIPDILARRGAAHPLRAWSAGCASGEEAWSLAILFADQGLAHERIVATDVSRPALEKARRGVYGGWSFRGEGTALTGRWLEDDENDRRVATALRDRVGFTRHNLTLDEMPSPARGLSDLDLILCRNVLLYLSREKVEQVFAGLRASLVEGGWLFLGPSDPAPAGFEVVVRDEGVFYRRASAAAAPAAAAHEDVPVRRPRSKPPVVAASAARTKKAPPPAPEPPPPGDALAELRLLANTDERAAERRCRALLAQAPDAIDVAYLHAVLLLALGRLDEAVRAIRRVLYLDRSSAAGHFFLAQALLKRGDRPGARRAFATSLALAQALAPTDAVALGDGETAGALANAAVTQLLLLDAKEQL